MGILVTLRILKKQTRNKMKLLILSLLVAYALCECPEVKDPECKGSDLRCRQGETDSEGCPMQEWCMHVDPYAHCSAKAQCPRNCEEDAYMCKGDIDHEGCQMGDSCFAKGSWGEGCPDICNQPCDYSFEEQCAVPPDSKGCQRGATCAPKDPTGRCSTVCPVYCNENEMMCPGHMDHHTECRMPDTCIAKDPKCPTHCPEHCRDDEDLCPGPVDANGCKGPDTCMPRDPKCGSMCPVHCPEGHMQCAGGTDWNGCRQPDTCIPVDEKAPCPAKCPLACNAGDLECPGTWKDENGCEQGEYCQSNDMTAICQYSCKAQCPEGEWVCPGKDNDQGCHVEGPCSAKGQCPE